MEQFAERSTLLLSPVCVVNEDLNMHGQEVQSPSRRDHGWSSLTWLSLSEVLFSMIGSFRQSALVGSIKSDVVPVANLFFST